MWTTIPVDPDADTAREWAIDELSKREYRDTGENWLDALWRWVVELFDSIGSVGDGIGVPGVVVFSILGLGIVALIIWIVVGPLRRSRRSGSTDDIFAGDRRNARTISTDAQSAAASGDWASALLLMYRAIVRSLDERGVIAVHAGMTAHEAAQSAGRSLPTLGARIGIDAEAFDRARYGHTAPTEQDFHHAAATFAAIPDAASRRVVVT